MKQKFPESNEPDLVVLKEQKEQKELRMTKKNANKSNNEDEIDIGSVGDSIEESNEVVEGEEAPDMTARRRKSCSIRRTRNRT